MPEWHGDWTKPDAPEWKPQGSAHGLADGVRRYSSVGQLWEVKNQHWVRIIDVETGAGDRPQESENTSSE